MHAFSRLCSRGGEGKFGSVMKRWLPLLLLCLLALPLVAAEQVVVIPVQGEISNARFSFIRRALKEAAARKASAVVLDMDTPGGSLDATKRIQQALQSSGLRVITYVNPDAFSAGALIAISTPEIYMAPASAIGGAAPVGPGGQDIPKVMEAKIVSASSGFYRSVAERNGHNPDLVDAFISKDKPVVVGGVEIHKQGSLLTLSAQEAARQINGKPVLAKGIAATLPDVLQQAGLAGAIVTTAEPTGFEFAAFWLTRLAPLFLLVGVVCGWMEIKTPGFGLPGMIAAVAFFLFFLAHYLAGLAGWEAGILFVFAVALIVVELLILPGLIIPGLVGVLLLAGALLLAMIDRYPGQPWSTALLERPLLNLGITVLLVGIVLAFLARWLPKTRFYSRLVLDTPHNPHASFSDEVAALEVRLPVGTEGVALSILRPSGRAELAGEVHDVITRGEFVDAGAALRLVAHEAGRIVVAAVDKGV